MVTTSDGSRWALVGGKLWKVTPLEGDRRYHPKGEPEITLPLGLLQIEQHGGVDEETRRAWRELQRALMLATIVGVALACFWFWGWLPVR